MESSRRTSGFKASVYLMLALSLGLVGLIFYIVGSNQKLFDAKYSVYMFKHDAESLIPGAFITLSGLKVGVVGKMKLTTRENKPGILIELKIDKDYKQYITSSSVAQIKTMGVLGDKYVDISMGKSGEPPLKPGDFIHTRTSVNMDAVMGDAAESLQQLRQVLTNLNTLTRRTVNGDGVLGQVFNDKKMGDDLRATVHNAKTLTDKLQEGTGSAGKFLNDSSFYRALLATTRNLQTITAKIARGKGNLAQVVNDSTLYPRLRSALAQTDSLLKGMNGQGTVGTLIRDKEFYDELLQLTRKLRVLAEDIKKHPEKYGSFHLF